jgi:porin
MKRAFVLEALFLGASLVVPLLLAKPAIAADSDCGSDSGIPSGVIAPIDVGHFRKSLGETGFTVGGFYLGETFANTGGIEQRATYDGVLWTYLLADLHKAGLWRGLCFYTDAYQIHGRSITADDIGSLATVSNYEALPSTRLSELWFEQHMFNDHLTVRVGQLTADTEFLLSSGASHFLDSTFGWATLPTFNLPGGGPSYPLATPGVRLELKPNQKLSLKLGVYNGDPAGANCTGNPQVCNDDGLDFRLDSPPLLIAESGYKYNQDARLPGTVKIGAWNQFGTFHTQPGSGNLTVAHTVGSVPIENDWAIYLIVDQLVWRVPDSKDVEGIGLFGRLIGAPSNQNLIDFYADGGITLSGMIPYRPEDTLGIGFAYTGISSNDGQDFGLGPALPRARGRETLLEICYTAQLKSGWTLQPDFQYIWQPGGQGTIPNAAVWGVRTTINF